MAVVFLVCYAMVESKPRYPYADRDPVVNDPAEITRTVHQLLQSICIFQCTATNKVAGRNYICDENCGKKSKPKYNFAG